LEESAQWITLSPPPDNAKIVTATEYLQPETLLANIAEIAASRKTDDLRVAASLWNKWYNNALLPPFLGYITLIGVGLDATLENVSIILCNGQPSSLLLHSFENTAIYAPRFPTPIPEDYTGKLVSSVEELHQAVFTGLFHNHLAVVIERVNSLTKLSKNVMWGNTANVCAGLYDWFAQCPNTEAQRTSDRIALLENKSSFVMPHRNPLYKLMRSEKLAQPDLPAEVTVRGTCCLIFRMPPNFRSCGSCPLLKTEERVVRIREKIAKAH
jgi:siderophore-iron reductase FhuF